MNIKQKVGIKKQQINMDIFLNQILWELIHCRLIQIKMPILNDLKLEDITYKKTLSRIAVADEKWKNFYDQPISSDTKRYEER